LDYLDVIQKVEVEEIGQWEFSSSELGTSSFSSSIIPIPQQLSLSKTTIDSGGQELHNAQNHTTIYI
jgi:hypothetical protein